jgi:hypothetical protein
MLNVESKRRGACYLIAAVLLLLSPLAPSLGRAAELDVVHLQNGGRIQGSVLEHDPNGNTTVELPDGRVRVIPAAEVARVVYAEGGDVAEVEPAGPAATGPTGRRERPASPRATVTITASHPGRIFVDGANRGAYDPADEPRVVDDLREGRHDVAIEWDEGGRESERVELWADQPTTVHLEMSPNSVLFRDRQGLLIGLEVGPSLAVFLGPEGSFRESLFGREPDLAAGFRAAGIANLGLHPLVSLRGAAFAGLLEVADRGAQVWPLGGSVATVLNLAPFYTMDVGLAMGALVASRGASHLHTAFLVGPEISPLCVRFGEYREIELELRWGILFAPRHATEHLMQWSASVRYFFVGDSASAPSGKEAARR